ncbi:cysteine desulfurase family protein [Streptococcus parauberis]|uniref:cysteine desulfurase family protein n=1 Tax=Streptococcus parauberis TaxID=1348 RepID=UPI000CCEDF93|nr:cysteine desulfurase family protein [Streptococcus parauberis]PNY19153.1 Cysteine desulfurase [Streptococcus parauberis]
MKNKLIYFDNAATTALSNSVIAAMTSVMASNFGNPSSIHSFGRLANKTLRECRQEIANLLDVPSRQLIYTSGGTESNNTAIKGYALAHQDKGKHIITTAIEHHSVLHTMDYLEKRFGFEITYLEAKDGIISLDEFQKALRPDTILVSMMSANNETGDLLPIAEVGDILKDHQAVFHVDAVQTMGKVQLFPKNLGINMMSASAHKFHGPKGVGFLYQDDVLFDPLLHGGDQEEKRRSSTENLIGIVGMTKALTDAYQMMSENYQHVEQLKEHLLEQLQGTAFYLNKGNKSLPHVINLGFPGQVNAMLLTRLDLSGVAVSTGSACTAGTVEPSHVLESYYGKYAHQLIESLRISFSDQNTIEEVDFLVDEIKKIIGE